MSQWPIVLLRLTYLAVTNAFAALRLLSMSDRDKAEGSGEPYEPDRGTWFWRRGWYWLAGVGVAASPTYPVSDGDSPIAAGCISDAQLIDKNLLYLNSPAVGAFELKYSPKCAAGWARAYLYPQGVKDGLSGDMAASR